KFAGAESTYTIEAMMHDGKALQSGTSHYFGDGFARAFKIEYTDRDNKLKNPYQTSWGMSTRLIGGIIMTHGDDNGLVLPPRIAPIQAVVIPIAAHKPGVNERAHELLDTLKNAGIRAKIDDSDNSPGWKFAEYEMKGVPVRIELGPRDIEAGQCVIVRRDNREKQVAPLDGIVSAVNAALDSVHDALYEKALLNRTNHTFVAHDLDEMKKIAAEQSGFVKAMWCGDEACELKIKDEAGMSSRCIPYEEEQISDVCAVCGKPAKHMAYWGVSY
ncbi:MAG: His/Gly/Thr/Pro-type tRNA ligase C-terminal domain-containing protein, partial [Clostridia bacterium]